MMKLQSWSLENADFTFKTAWKEARQQLHKNVASNIEPGGNTLQGTNYTATCLPSRKLSKLDKPDT